MSRMDLGPTLNTLLWEGKTLTTKTVECGSCKNQWFVMAGTDEVLQRFCCYCGCEFSSKHVIGDDSEGRTR